MKLVLKILLTCLILAAAGAAGLGGLFWFYSLPAADYGPLAEGYILIEPGETISSVGNRLEEDGIIRSARCFYLTARIGEYSMKAGYYHLSGNQSVQDILEVLHEGKENSLKVTVPEGLTLKKTAALMERSGIVSAEEFIQAAADRVLLEKYHIPGGTAEGYLFPDTYFLIPGMSGGEVVTLMLDTFFKRIDAELVPHSSFARLSAGELHETVILASIIEREYRNSAEAPLISSVFTNRLRKNIGLESCATVEYIITEINGLPHPEVITRTDLAINNQYNTYKWAGLPPGPIASPGMTALTAAANPEETDFYYFRVMDPAAGTHYFSKNLSEHINAGQLYTKRAAGE